MPTIWFFKNALTSKCHYSGANLGRAKHVVPLKKRARMFSSKTRAPSGGTVIEDKPMSSSMTSTVALFERPISKTGSIATSAQSKLKADLFRSARPESGSLRISLWESGSITRWTGLRSEEGSIV